MRFSFLALLVLFCRPALAAEPHPPRQRIPLVALSCTGCHGASGEGYGSIPRINGKPAGELVRKMREFQAGKSTATVMNRIARGFSDDDLAELAKFFSPR